MSSLPPTTEGSRMSKLKVLSVSCMLALAALPGPVFAQYIYIDANGDGINTSADSLNAVGPTILTIYLSTNHDKDGSLQTCNSHSAANCGATGTAQPLNIFSYQIYLSAVGGTVTWGTFTPDSSAFATLQTQLQDTHDVEVTFARQPAGSISPPGLMALGKIPVTITSGSPSITFPRYPNTGLDANSFGTAFGTNCVAFTFGNSYVLGDRADSCGAVSGIPGDWFDADGAREPRVTVRAGRATSLERSRRRPVDASRRGQGHGLPGDRLRPPRPVALHEPALLGGRLARCARAIRVARPLPRRRGRR